VLEGLEGGIQQSFFSYYAPLKQTHLCGVVRRKTGRAPGAIYTTGTILSSVK